MLESITNFFSLSLVELSVYDLVILVLFVSSLVLTLIFGLIVVATKVRKLNSDIDNQINTQLSNDKAIINYLDLIMNQLSNSKVALKSNGEIREDISKKETNETTSYSSSIVESSVAKNESVSEEKKSVDTVSTVDTLKEVSLQDKKEDIKQDQDEYKEEKPAYTRRSSNRNSLEVLENEIKNIPLERKKIINNVVENINTLNALEEVSQKIEEKIKETENQQNRTNLRDSSSQSRRRSLSTDNESISNTINTLPVATVESIPLLSTFNSSEVPVEFRAEQKPLPNNIPVVNTDVNKNLDLRADININNQQIPSNFTEEQLSLPSDNYQTVNSDVNKNLDYRSSNLRSNINNHESLSSLKPEERPNLRPTLTRNTPLRSTSAIREDLLNNRREIRDTISSSLKTSRPISSSPYRTTSNFGVDRNTNFSNNVGRTASGRFSELNDSIGNSRVRANFKPLSLNILNRNNSGNSYNRVNQSSLDVETNNKEGQENMYNNVMDRSRTNNSIFPTNRNPSMGMNSSMGTMNNNMNRSNPMNNRAPMGMNSSIGTMNNNMNRSNPMNNRAPMGMNSSIGTMNNNMNRSNPMNNRAPMGMSSSMGTMNNNMNRSNPMNNRAPMGMSSSMGTMSNNMNRSNPMNNRAPMGMNSSMGTMSNNMNRSNPMNNRVPMGMNSSMGTMNNNMNRSNPMNNRTPMGMSSSMGTMNNNMNRSNPMSNMKPANATVGNRPQLSRR